VAHTERWLVPTLPDPDDRGEAAARIVAELA
jgi:hypothetical protein